MYSLYKPAHQLWENISANNFKSARAKTTWDDRVHQSWDSIRFLDFGKGPEDHVMSGSAVPLRTTVDLAGLEPSEVRVEAVIGQVGANGNLQDTFVLLLKPVGTFPKPGIFNPSLLFTIRHFLSSIGHRLPDRHSFVPWVDPHSSVFDFHPVYSDKRLHQSIRRTSQRS